MMGAIQSTHTARCAAVAAAAALACPNNPLELLASAGIDDAPVLAACPPGAPGVVDRACACARRCCSCRCRSNGGIVGIDMNGAGAFRDAAAADDGFVTLVGAEDEAAEEEPAGVLGERWLMCSSSVNRALTAAFPPGTGVVLPPPFCFASSSAGYPFGRWCPATASSESWLP